VLGAEASGIEDVFDIDPSVADSGKSGRTGFTMIRATAAEVTGCNIIGADYRYDLTKL
jgi:hypothetical protein